MTEPIDEPAINNVGDFNDFKFVDVTREGLDLGDIPEEDKKKVNTSASFALVHQELCWPYREMMTCDGSLPEAVCCQGQ